MQKLLSLCLRQVFLSISIASILTSIITMSVITISLPAFAQEAPVQERGIRMRGPKSSDVFPYERYGPLNKRDTLWKIALTVRPDSRLTVYQVMQALYQANPNSFVEGNLNHLVEGQYLNIPSFDRMMLVNDSIAQQKSKEDDEAWQKKQPKEIKTKPVPIESLNKKDLDTVKVEINDQLEKIDNKQQVRLESIQKDVSDSIDGLQTILKENEALRQRLSSFNSQLGTMQKEVAKSEEIKLQMDDMIKLQQALLARAQAREQELLLEKQQAELEKNKLFSSSWFTVLMSILPAALLLIIIWLIFKRRKAATDSSEVSLESPTEKPIEKKEKAKSEKIVEEEPESPKDEELSLDDDLSIDLLEDDEDEVIHLDESDDEALDDLDDLDDILLDDDTEALEGGELGQDDLDSLLMEVNELSADEDEVSGEKELSQSDLDDLLGGSADDDVDVDEFLIDQSPEENDDQAEVSDPDDIAALLSSINANEAASKEELADDDDQAEISDPDDIDALFDSINAEEPSATDEQAEITDPDDIDALLDSMNIDDAAPESEEAPAADEQAEITDPDDIDALLDSMNIDDAAPEAEEESPIEITDPNDIDALLASMDIDVPDTSSDITNEDEVVAGNFDGIEDNNVQVENSENRAKIENFSEEYISPLLSADFSDVLAKASAEPLTEPELIEVYEEDIDEEDFDIDELIAEVEQSSKDSDEEEQSPLDDELFAEAFDEAFDEDTLVKLLNDEESEPAIELMPDFSDQKVLADLLNDNVDDSDNQVSEANEINDIQELNNLDFDELLANIEEESSVANQPVDFNQNLDIGDEIILEDFDNFNASNDFIPSGSGESSNDQESFVSVDSLLSDSQEEVSSVEPYEKANIDVGLNDFPEFTDDVNHIDVDADENGVAAKLDLAKVYLEIGDEDNAQVILKEVVKLGDHHQQAEARTLLNEFLRPS